MQLKEQDKKLFESLHKNQYGKLLLDYLERLNIELFNPDEVTPENLSSRKDAISIIKKEIIDRIKIVSEEKKGVNTNTYV